MDKTLISLKGRLASGLYPLWGATAAHDVHVLDPKGDIDLRVEVFRKSQDVSKILGSPNSIYHNQVEMLGVGKTGLIGIDGSTKGTYSATQARTDLLLSIINQHFFDKAPGKPLALYLKTLDNPFPGYTGALIANSVVGVRSIPQPIVHWDYQGTPAKKVLETMAKVAGKGENASKIDIVTGYFHRIVARLVFLYSRRIVFTNYSVNDLDVSGLFYTAEGIAFLPDYRDMKMSNGKRIRGNIVGFIEELKALLVKVTGTEGEVNLPDAQATFNRYINYYLIDNAGFTKETKAKLLGKQVFEQFTKEYVEFVLDRTDETFGYVFDKNYWHEPRTYEGEVGRRWVMATRDIHQPLRETFVPATNLGKNILTLLSSDQVTEMNRLCILSTMPRAKTFKEMFMVKQHNHWEAEEPGIGVPAYVFESRIKAFKQLLVDNLPIKYSES